MQGLDVHHVSDMVGLTKETDMVSQTYNEPEKKEKRNKRNKESLQLYRREPPLRL